MWQEPAAARHGGSTAADPVREGTWARHAAGWRASALSECRPVCDLPAAEPGVEPEPVRARREVAA